MNDKIKRKIYFGALLTIAALFCCAAFILAEKAGTEEPVSEGYIKWVDYGVTAEAMNDALAVDIETYQSDNHISWIDILAYLGAKYGGNFKSYKKTALVSFTEKLKSGGTVEDITKDMKYFSYYKEAYSAVLSAYVGEFYRDGQKLYGLRVYSPIAAGYYYSHSDDFGAARSYGYKREHLGHDMMGSVGTPVVAVESGYIEALGWNQYGGWRIGIRSFDNKRYYYYAHLRKGHPYTDIKEGDIVLAGEVVGYIGMTGYSAKEDVNNINVPHLHFGIQLIFDASQKDGNNQIWIDAYELTKFLYKNRMPVIYNKEKGDFEPSKPISIFDIPD